jgi:hypothetical protein
MSYAMLPLLWPSRGRQQAAKCRELLPFQHFNIVFYPEDFAMNMDLHECLQSHVISLIVACDKVSLLPHEWKEMLFY